MKGVITMAINLSSQEEIRKLTLKDLIADAVERKREDGTVYEVDKSIVSIRAEYIKKFLDYKPASTLSKEMAKARKREKREKEREDMFRTAFEELNKSL